jgi:predicted PurR-regulated permease PerM
MMATELLFKEILSKRILLGILLTGLGVECFVVLQPFIAPIIWASILAYVTWPLYRWLRKPLAGFNSTGAFVMTVLVSCAVVAPMLWFAILVRDELFEAFRAFTAFLAHGPHTLPSVIHNIPWLGERVQAGLDRYAADPSSLSREFMDWAQTWSRNLTGVIGDIGRNLGKLSLAVVTLFFFYRDGDALVRQSRRIITRFFSERLDSYIGAAGVMIRAVLYGFLFTAVAQGSIAGMGYLVVGLEAPALLGALTGILSVVPILGTAFVWGPIGAWLLLTGHLWKGIVMLAWGVLLVHPTDNVLRPLLISNATRVPFLLVMLGALGGVVAFGFVGVFIGPLLLGLAVSVWREWANEDAGSS